MCYGLVASKLYVAFRAIASVIFAYKILNKRNVSAFINAAAEFSFMNKR